MINHNEIHSTSMTIRKQVTGLTRRKMGWFRWLPGWFFTVKAVEGREEIEMERKIEETGNMNSTRVWLWPCLKGTRSFGCTPHSPKRSEWKGYLALSLFINLMPFPLLEADTHVSLHLPPSLSAFFFLVCLFTWSPNIQSHAVYRELFKIACALCPLVYRVQRDNTWRSSALHEPKDSCIISACRHRDIP